MSEAGRENNEIEKDFTLGNNGVRNHGQEASLLTGIRENGGAEKKKKIKWFVYGEALFLKRSNPEKGKQLNNTTPVNPEEQYDPETELQAIDSIEPKDLQILSRNQSARIRAAVAFNPMTTCPVLQRLASDPNDSVRYAVSRNTSTSEKILQVLLKDSNPNISKMAIARSIGTSQEILASLALDLNIEIKRKVALNSATSLEILEALALDPDKTVSSAAIYKVKKIKKINSNNI